MPFEKNNDFTMHMKDIAIRFGLSLDKDDFNATEKLLSSDCKYLIGHEVIYGPISICQSYEQNMIAGRKKLDVLEWGKSKVESINNFEFYIHFTDYLTHKGKKFVYKCKQKLTIGKDNLIIRIQHKNDPKEQKRLDEYYESVGLK